MSQFRVDSSAGVGFGEVEKFRFGIGLFGSVSETELEARLDGVPDYRLAEQFQSQSVGPMLLASYDHHFSENFSVGITGRAAALYVNGELDATQSSATGTFDVSDRQQTLGFFSDLQLDATYRLSQRLALSLFGGVSLRDDTFEIRNPRSGPGIRANDPTSYNPGPAHLEQTRQFEAFAGLKISLKF